MKELLLGTPMHKEEKAECCSCRWAGGYWQGWGGYTESLELSMPAESLV